MNKKLRVLMTGYEIAPFYKFGGLGDVMGSLPEALKEVNVDCRVVVPYYQEIRENFKERKIGEFYIHFGDKKEEISIYEGFFSEDRVVIYFLSNKPNLSHIKTHGRNKKIDQFAFFDLAVTHFVLWLLSKGRKAWNPTLIHCNDWHTALIPLILKQIKLSIPTLLTIHNLSYQGWGSREVLNLLHIKEEDAKELKQNVLAREINILGEGIIHATRVSTVSKTYAEEISHPNHQLIYKYIQKREEKNEKDGRIIGILNGIDYNVWNPEKDEFIAQKFSLSDWFVAKTKNKEDLLKRLNLLHRPTFCFVGRMASQKGLDIIIKTAKKLVDFNINIIILGSGDPSIEKNVEKKADEYPLNIRAIFSYSEELAHKVYAGSDFILIPSHFEPCGLIQMIAMRYGTLPVASKTGGLKDSIKDNSSGFLFEKDKTMIFVKAVKRALRVYKDTSRYKIMVKRAMETDFNWRKSAIKYKKIYFSTIKHA